MYLDYSKLSFDADGLPEVPEVALLTMSMDMIGVIPGITKLEFDINFSEISEISFDVAAVIDGEPNWIYSRLSGYKILYTKEYGIYITMNPEIEADGIEDTVHIKGYSLEKELEMKEFFLEEGTFKFYDQTNMYNEDTLMGRILEIAIGWKAGYVSSTIAQKYRTFDEYTDYILPFIYDTAPEKYRCFFVFDPYEKTINVYDADEEVSMIPIYLDFDNLVENIEIEEKSDELVTALRPYGADDLNIRDVNPIGTNWMYDLSYFIANGDIFSDLANKWESWQRSILNNQELYRGLVAMRASATAQVLSAQAALTELNGELETLVAQQSVTIQALALETTEAGIASQQALLDEINEKIAAKEAEIAAQEAQIESLQEGTDSSNPNSYAAQIQEIVNELSITNYFTDEEYEMLSHYFIEQDVVEETFVASDIDTSVSGSSYSLSGGTILISDSAISRVEMSNYNKRMYTFSGGTFDINGTFTLDGDVIRGTLEEGDDGSYVLSLYAGTITTGTSTAASGTITASGSYTRLTSDIKEVTVDEITTYEGTTLSFTSSTGSLYLTANCSDYQRYSVEMELFDYGAEVLDDLSSPTYEFSLDSGNFIFAQEFAPFRNALELGKGVYLNIGHDEVIKPYIIELEFEFEDQSKFSLTFSNRFKRHDNCNTLKDMIETSYSSSRSFDASKYIYNQIANQSTSVSDFMNSSLEAAKNTIIGAANQSVVIDGAGIHVGGDSNYQIRIVDSMIAMTDDNWATAKLAIGLFASEEIGTYWGVNADVIGGKLLIGNNLVLENVTDRGVMQFKVDSSGAWLNNATFILQSDTTGYSLNGVQPLASGGGCILLDPRYGIVAGNSSLFTTSGTTVNPSFVDSDGDIITDSDGFPVNSNFFMDITSGDAYFRGDLVATSGQIGGFTIADDYLHTGTSSNYVAINGSGTNTYSAYAIWAGGSTPSTANFWVKKDGSMSATNGTFSGTLSAPKLSGNLTSSDDEDGWLIGCGININNKKFYVDTSGNVTMAGSIVLSGSITWSSSSSPVRVLYARTALATPTGSYDSYGNTSTTNWHKTYDSTYDYYASYSYDGGSSWTSAIKIRGEDGSSANVTEDAIFNILTNGGTKFGLFSDYNGALYINASYINTGTMNAERIGTGNLDATNITFSNNYGGFIVGRGSTDTSTTHGPVLYGPNGLNSSGQANAPYIIVTESGARMSGNSNRNEDLYVLDDNICATHEISITSDRRIKKDIVYDMDGYYDFFMDLKPALYKYVDGNSDRYHTGYIAQDVEDALTNSGIDTKDFAALVIDKNEKDWAYENITDELYGLRYGEFISLNTYMIQKLFKKFDELENKLELLEEQLNEK